MTTLACILPPFENREGVGQPAWRWMYYVFVQTLPESVLEYIRKHELLKAGDRAGVAVSGGADSVALLRMLLELRQELGVVLSVVHFNHKLRGSDSEEDERFVAELALGHKLELHCECGDVSGYAAAKHLSVETAARAMRYEYFRRLLLAGKFNRLATAHTLDDQAETVILKLARGAGSRGLAGIYPQLSVPSSQFSDGSVSIIRPLLGTGRKDVEAYLNGLGQVWREDKSNRDLRHARNRVRHGILPRMERHLNPAVRQALAETAEIARAEESFWAEEVARVLPGIWDEAAACLKLAVFELPLALQRRVLRAVAESLGLRLDFQHVDEILALRNRSGRAELRDGWVVSRNREELRFEHGSAAATGSDYEYRLSIPGSIEVMQTGSRFEATLVPDSANGGYNSEFLLDRALLAAELRIRNWRPGDRFWPAHSKAAKKIKELLQERQVTGGERKLWPVAVSGTEVVWVRGFAAPAQLRPREGKDQAVLIREIEQRGK